MRKLFIIFILFCAQNIFADSLSINGVEVGADAPTYPSSNCINSIGLKVSDLTLADAREYKRGKTFASFGGDYSEYEPDEKGCCCFSGGCIFGGINPDVKKSQYSWIASEPIGGILGGMGGMVVGAIMGGFLFMAQSDEDYAGIWGMLAGIIPGYVIGTGFGVWGAGKYIEREKKGNLFFTVLGAIAGGAIPAFCHYKYICKGNPTIEDENFEAKILLLCPIISGVLVHRLTLNRNIGWLK